MGHISKISLIIGFIVILAIVGFVIWFALQPQEDIPPVSAIMPTPSAQSAAQEYPEQAINISATNTSDAAMDQDLATIDKQLDLLDKDSSTVTEGLNAPAAPEQ